MKPELNSYLVRLLLIGLIYLNAGCGTNQTSSSSNSEEDGTQVSRGEVLHTRYFDVMVTKARRTKRITIGGYEELKQEEGNEYLVLEVTLKNTDTESRMMFDGEVHIVSGGQEYKYEQAETIGADGWGIIMENINPGITMKTNIVYKIPEGVNGQVYYYPARSESGDRIYIASLY